MFLSPYQLICPNVGCFSCRGLGRFLNDPHPRWRYMYIVPQVEVYPDHIWDAPVHLPGTILPRVSTLESSLQAGRCFKGGKWLIWSVLNKM
jgi:hypothetical protein